MVELKIAEWGDWCIIKSIKMFGSIEIVADSYNGQ